MIYLLGSTGYIGSAFAEELTRRNLLWQAVKTSFCLRAVRSSSVGDLVINCAAFIPHDSVAKCDENMGQTIESNVMLPARIAAECDRAGSIMAHISTACLWSDGEPHIESDPPQRAFTGHCGFYVGTKVLAERAVAVYPQHYIWRIRLPFDGIRSNRNYLMKLATMPEIWDHENTVCHRGDFVSACLDSWERHIPYGTYNVVNHGHVRAVEVVEKMVELGIRKTPFKVVSGPQGGAKVIGTKLMERGVKIRSAKAALAESLEQLKSYV